ncbi:hypothetical protein [Aromatoleum anaerobium]|uniref:Uncharacterized protein n=1 Tax=Aromatoleum anaerobium TaxID=182180 RepID=A0ABX1PRB1_9RHOO|nr:hypothetical protein [Aromatoleum anaerobium]MCK0507968.1 hypothetical protein [Aromatoleum anaerobium]
MTMIDTADHVRHIPTGEEWVVACVIGERLSWCGWPEGTAALSDCELVKKATPEYRDALLLKMAKIVGAEDHRGRYAVERIASLSMGEYLEDTK